MHLEITGLGVVSPLGIGRQAWQDALNVPQSARETAFRTSSEVLKDAEAGSTWSAEVWGWNPKEHLGAKGHRSFDRLTKFLITAAGRALEDAGIKADGSFVEGALSPADIGICSATAYGSLDAITELNRVAELEDPRYINPTRFPNTVINAAAGYVSIWQDLRAPNTTVVDGNCGGLDAVLAAETHLHHRRGKAFLVGGGEVVTEPLYLALRKLGMLKGAESDGVEVGEGACYLVVEPKGSAQERPVLAFLRGYGTAFEAPESDALLVHASKEAVSRAIEDALRDAELEAGDIDVVCASHCGIEAFDETELEGIRDTLGDVCIAAPKRLFGETFGAAGAFGMASCIAWMHGAPVAPIVAGSAPDTLRHTLVLSIGYYGNVSAVILSAPEEPQKES